MIVINKGRLSLYVRGGNCMINSGVSLVQNIHLSIHTCMETNSHLLTESDSVFQTVGMGMEMSE